MSQSILISGGTLANGKKSDLLIKDGLIAEMAEKIEDKEAKRIDASHSIVLPGLVDLTRTCASPEEKMQRLSNPVSCWG